MNKNVRNLIFAVFFGTAFVLPLTALEYANTQGFNTYGFPAALYGALWLLAFVFAFVFFTTIRAARSGGVSGHPFRLAFGALFMITIAVFWVTIVNDQMPCFLGVPNCD